MALHSLYCADVPLRNCSLTHSGCASYCLYRCINPSVLWFCWVGERKGILPIKRCRWWRHHHLSVI